MTPTRPCGSLWPWWRRVWVVSGKETRDHLRDRRSLALALVYPLLGPLLISLLLLITADGVKNGAPVRPMAIPAVGAEHAPALAGFLARYRVTLVSGKGSDAIVRQQREPVLLEIPPAAADGDYFAVRLLYDANNMVSVSVAGMLEEMILRFGRDLSRQRLEARGLDARLLQPITVERVQAGRRISPALLFYKLIPPLAVFMIFLGAVYLAVDTTAGERERGTLEPLLTAPIRRWELLLGKALAALLFTLFAVVLNLTAFRVVLGVVTAQLSGVEPPPDTQTFLGLFGLSLPLMVLAVALQITIAALTRSMKEAQIYLGLLPLVPALPGVATSLSPVTPQLWMAGIPVFGQMVMFGQLMAGQELESGFVALSVLATLLAAALIFWWASHLFDRERLFLSG